MAQVMRQMFTLKDENGQTARVSIARDLALATTDPTIGLMALALLGVTAAGESASSLHYDTTGVTTPQPGPYGCEDGAAFLFTDSAARPVIITVPAPLRTVFGTDDKTVDPADPFVDSFVSACLLYAKSADGHALLQFVRGWRTRTSRKE